MRFIYKAYILFFNRQRARYLLFCYITVVVVCNIINFGKGHIELNRITVLELRADFWMHICMFLPWAFFVRMTGCKQNSWFFAGMTFVFFTEYIQLYLPYRSFYIFDLFFNFIGFLSGYAILAALKFLPEKFLYSGADIGR